MIVTVSIYVGFKNENEENKNSENAVAMVGQTVDISNLWNSRGIREVLIRLLTR